MIQVQWLNSRFYNIWNKPACISFSSTGHATNKDFTQHTCPAGPRTSPAAAFMPTCPGHAELYRAYRGRSGHSGRHRVGRPRSGPNHHPLAQRFASLSMSAPGLNHSTPSPASRASWIVGQAPPKSLLLEGGTGRSRC